MTMSDNKQFQCPCTHGSFFHRVYFAGFASIVACASAGTARAQEASAVAQEQLQEVVVTAQRRVENLQTTPIAATVLDATSLDRKSVTDISDLQNASPALSITNFGVVSFVNIRGEGLDSNSPQVVPGVATYRDGLWQPPVGTSSSFYDVGSVEVLRGPQGTFVGSNSTGGAIFINSNSPSLEDQSGRIEVLLGNYADAGANGEVNLPLNDRWATRIAFNVERRNSFYDNIASSVTPIGAQFNTPGALDEKDLRLGEIWKPTDELTFLLKSDFTDKSTGGYAMKPIPGTAYAPYAPTDPWTINFDQGTKADETALRNSLEVRWQPSPDGITYRSLTGYQYLSIRNIYDVDATNSRLPGPPAQADYEAIDERPITEEINVISPDKGRLQWIVGAFYLHDTRDVGHNITSQSFPQSVLIDFYTILKTAAVFGQLSYKITPRLELQVGGRFTHDDVSNPPGGFINIGPGAAYVDASGSHTDSATTGKVALNWTVNEDNFLYGFVAKGFKGGGFTFGNPPGQFQPEIVWDYELGWKSYFLQHHVRTQIGGFWNDYQNLQVSVIDTASGANQLTNIGKSTIDGAEAQIEGQFGGLRVDASGAYVKSKLGAISLVNARLIPGGGALNLGPQCGPGAPAAPGCFDYTPFIVSVNGRPNPYSPKWTFNAGAEYQFGLSGGATLTPRINYSYVGALWTTLVEAPVTDYLRSYGLWNASVTFAKGDWRVEAFGRNLANASYVLGQYNNAELFGNPRQFGVRVSRTF
jgi:iron complex outermembrane receptor protein